jgi:TRAP transporter TAXI family solute receptor
MKHWLRSVFDFLTTWGGAILLIVAGFWLAYQYVEPAPPDTLRMATGDPEGAYHRFAKRYRELLGREGVTLELLPTAGSVANLGMLVRSEDPVDVALVQGGVVTEGLDDRLASLGSLFYEPIWLFHGSDWEPGRLTELLGKRVGIGAEGSGTRALALALLSANGVEAGNTELVASNAKSGAEALLAGELDALFIIASPTASIVQRLAADPSVDIMGFERADAYVRRYRYITKLDLPEGSLSLAENRPASDITLLAVTANLVARKDLHPALVDLLLQVASEVHSGPGIFEDQGEFPSPRYLVLPLDGDAARFYRYGPPFLQRYLPFWAANLVDRLKIMLLPLVALLIPLMRVTPPVYRWRIRSRVYRWYKELQRIDPGRGKIPPDGEAIEERLQALERLEHEVNRVRVPLSYADELYHLRMHMDLVRRDLEVLRQWD